MTPPEMQRKAIFAHLETIMETCDPKVAREALAECGLYTLDDAAKKIAAVGVQVDAGPLPFEAWAEYAMREGLLDMKGIAPDPRKTGTAFAAFAAGWNAAKGPADGVGGTDVR